ncbi:hypothetical protein J7J64_10870 [Lysobacter sp. ISL-42]|uniref:hypothetical protein n=2 Tax=Lysobacter TaxID=68 RepID=UPI001BEA35E2|nr:hypothetical protein [Lysobacter sp. ISL-42]MBT2746912.1 hypothetical protein [Lysobacter sp. ISL-42]
MDERDPDDVSGFGLRRRLLFLRRGGAAHVEQPMSWRGPPSRWQRMRVPTLFPWLKVAILAFFTVLVMAPITGWLMSLPMWAMDVLGYLLSSPLHTQSERWFRAGLVLAGVPSLIAVGWRARQDRDFDMGVMTAIATLILMVGLIAHYRWIEMKRGGRENAVIERIEPRAIDVAPKSFVGGASAPMLFFQR